MSTNYYAWVDTCEECGHPKQELHIGKWSSGWSFHFEAHPDRDLCSVASWRKLLDRDAVRIFDEYERELTAKEFWKIVRATRGGQPSNSPGSWFDPEGWVMTPREFS